MSPLGVRSPGDLRGPGYPSVILAVHLCHTNFGPPEGGYRRARACDPDGRLPIHRRQRGLHRFLLLCQGVRCGNPPLTQVRGHTMHAFDCSVWVQGACPTPGPAGTGPGASAIGFRSGTGIA